MSVCLSAITRTLTVTIGAGRLSIEDVLRVAKGEANVALAGDPEFARRIRSGAQYLERLLAGNGVHAHAPGAAPV